MDMSFSSDAWHLVAVCTNGNVTVWNLGRNLRTYTFKHEYAVQSAVVSSDGHRLITVAANRARLWIIDDHTLGWCIPQVHVSMAFFTPDGKGVLVTGRNGTEEWDAASMELCWKVDGEPITGIAFSSQGQGLCRH
jgi:WD40 repeat protein